MTTHIEAEPMALVALSDDDRVALGFACSVLEIHAESEASPALCRTFEVEAKRLRAVYDRARRAASGGQAGPERASSGAATTRARG